MPDSDYQTLLDATITHLEDLKRRGERFVHLDPANLADLVGSAPRRSAVSAAAPAPAGPAFVAPAAAPARSIAAALSSASPTPPPAVRPAVAIRPPSSPAPTRTVAAAAPAASITAAVPPGRVLAPDEKVAAMAELRERASACVMCSHLASSRRSVVFGVGDIHSPLMFVGEAPGADEDVQGEPFVGAAGQLLTKIIQTMGLGRDKVYIGNVLKCRPNTPGQNSGNRKPTHEEMATCLPYLKEQIRIIRPKVIVALGATAMEGLFGKSPVYITKLRGQWQELDGIAVMPTYHPSYVLRNQSLATKRETWTDMLAAMERLGMSISEKQRGYFLSAS